jgi:hypothetical protein
MKPIVHFSTSAEISLAPCVPKYASIRKFRHMPNLTTACSQSIEIPGPGTLDPGTVEGQVDMRHEIRTVDFPSRNHERHHTVI